MAYYEDIIIVQSGKTKCELCNIDIQDSDRLIEDHINDKNHAKLFMKRLMIQNNIKMKGNRLVCGVCDKVLALIDLVDHIQSSCHKDLMERIKKVVLKDGGFLVLPETITELGPAINCLVCNRAVDLNLNALNSHVGTEIHRRARSIAVQPLNAIFSVESSKGDLFCKICQVYFENYVEIINEHVDEDPKHVKEIGKLFLLIKDQSINIENFLHDPKEDKAICMKCQIEVPCNLDNLAGHIGGKKHKS